MGKLKKAIATFLVACMTMVTPLSAGMSNVSASETKQTNLKTKMMAMLLMLIKTFSQ